MIKSIHIYDFDNTLMHTPNAEDGIAAWEEMTGQIFPTEQYWESPESLDHRLTIITPNLEVIDAAERSANNSSVLSVLMTGRREHLRPAIMNLIELHDLLLFADYYLASGDTLTYKQNKIRELFDKYPHVVEIVVWDDRSDYWLPFEQMSCELGIPVYVNRVINGCIQ